jgi:ethanolaminephosphotransferase
VLLGLVSVHFLGLGLFCLGFFPSKIVLQGINQFNNDGITDGQFDPIFNKVVVMVVDALRSDFVFSERSEMKFSHELLQKGAALGFTAFSNPPTVTLPRLKGITTGSTPNFLDAVLNVIEGDSSNNLAKQDSWIQQLKANGKRIHMFGDDTWLKLFPGMFDVKEGTASFFVSDFTEVDNNVTRHLDHELEEQDWDCLILHYLGLDHIGHKGGPNSSFMKPKQAEMDGIIADIYNKLEDDTLFIVLGDHGMNEIGNHGGSSKGETSAALLFISDKFKAFTKGTVSPLPYNDDYEYYSKIQQIDLVPTIASLLHLPIPINSLGIFVKQLLPLWNSEQQQKNVVLDTFNHFKNFRSDLIPNNDISGIYDQLHNLQSELTQDATNYDIPKILLGIFVNLTCIAISIIISFKSIDNYKLIFANIAIPLTVGLSSFGSSLVEEEHQIWWWIIMAVGFISLIKLRSFEVLKVLLYLRLLRNWNNMGQKFINENSFDAALNLYPVFKWLLIVLTIYETVFRFRDNNGAIVKVWNVINFMCILTFKVLFAEVDGQYLPWSFRISDYVSLDFIVRLSSIFFIFFGATLIIRIILLKAPIHRLNVIKDINDLITIVLVYQASINNITMFLILNLMKDSIISLFSKFKNKTDNSTNIALSQNLMIILQNAIFFNFGQTNSLPTIDLSNSYNGVTEYSMLPIGILTFLNNFGGVIFCTLVTFQLNFNDHGLKTANFENELKLKFLLNLNYYLIVSVFYLVSCFLQRYHLFIWTVFSPKILFLLAWNLFMNLLELAFAGGYLLVSRNI